MSIAGEPPPDTGFAPEPTGAYPQGPTEAPRIDLGAMYGLGGGQDQRMGSVPTLLDQSLMQLSDRDRAEIEAEQLLAQGRAREQSKQRLKDLSVVDIVTRDMEESRQRSEALIRRMDEVQRRLQAPAPALPTGTQYNEQEMLGMALGSLLAPGSAGQIIEAGQGIARQRQTAEFQNQAQAWEQEQALARDEHSLLQGQARDETSYQRDLRRMQVGAIADEQQREADKVQRRLTRGRELQTAYNGSNLPGEKQAIADAWRREFEAGQVDAAPPAREAVAADIQAIRSPEVAREMTRYKEMLKYHTSTYGSDPTVVAELEATRAFMVAQYFDGNEAAIPKIPSAKTLQEQQLAEKRRQFDANLALANKRFEFIKGVQFPQQMAARWASIQVMRDSLRETAFRNNVYAGQAAMRGGGMDVSGGAAALGEYDDATGSFIRDFAGDTSKGAIKRLIDIDADLANKKGQLANKGALTGKKEDELTSEIAGLEAEKAHLVKLINDMQADRAQLGLQPVDPFQAARDLANAGSAARTQFPRDRPAPGARPPAKTKAPSSKPKTRGLAPGVTRVG